MNDRLSKLFYNSRLELLARWTLGLTFIYASFYKIIEPAHFAKIIYGYYLFPDYSINLVAIILPFMEFFSGLALVLGIYPRSAILIINTMLLGFIIAVTINLVRGHEFDCGCFSFGEAGYISSTEQLLIRDIIYFILGLYVLFFDKRRRWCIRQTGNLLHRYPKK